MAGEVKLAVVKKTQDTLGKYVKRPPLTEKLLRKPPFRFLHDVITTVVRESKFLSGLFTDHEMNSENVTDKESKIAFLQKVIDVVNISCGVSLLVRPSKVVAGYEPEKTNELLQIIGKAIEKKVDSSEAVQKVLSKSKGSNAKEQANESKPLNKKEEVGKSKKAAPPQEKKPSKDKAGTSKPPKATPRGEEREKRTTNREERVNPANTKEKKPKRSDEKEVHTTRDAKSESKSKAHTSKEKKKAGEDGKPESNSKRSSVEVKEKVGKAEGGARERRPSNTNNVHTEEVAQKGSVKEGEVVEKVQKKASLDANDVEVEESFPSLDPLLSERDNPQDSIRNAIEPTAAAEEGEKSGSAKKNHPKSGNNKANEDLRTTASSGQRMAIATPVLRPSSIMSMAPSRPRSSRPRAPRLRSALGGLIAADETDKVKGKNEQIESQVEGIGDGIDDADAKEFLVEEARPPSATAKEVKQGVGEEEELAGEEGEKQQGLLVAKILETKKELEAGIEEGVEGPVPLKRVEIEYSEDEVKRRRKGLGEVETLQSLVQAIARAAHPLGSLLGMLQENVEALRSETSRWRADCERLVKLLREEEKQMEVELEPLRSVLLEVEQSVLEEREAVTAAKARVLKAEQRIQVMLDPKGNSSTQGIA